MSRKIGDMLVAAGAVTETQLAEALSFQRGGGMRVGEALLRLGHIDESTLARALAKLAGIPFVDLDRGRVSEAALESVPAEFAREQGILPIREKDGKLVVAIDDPLKRIVADQLEFTIGRGVVCALAGSSALKRALDRCYGPAAEEEVAVALSGDAADAEGDAPIVRLVTRMIQDALELRASDIHIEPSQAGLRIRYRVDGILREVAEHPGHLAAPLLSRLKIMASMDIAEKRKPQDGRMGLKISGRDIDVRASLLPTDHGESMVLRLLDRSVNLLRLEDLGFRGEDKKRFDSMIEKPNGIVLVTGPTGSGKTTTLYAALSELNRPDAKIITAEDPVEYHIPGINQVQVRPGIGLTFARVLKAMLRAAPNIILVGEIRDLETAEVAIQAALTGHLVFSTLHTNDAPSAITRLVDMGVKPFLVSASVQGIMAQRLVRRLCAECSEEYEPEDDELRALDLDPALYTGRTFRRQRGCRACGGVGYRGRLGLFELLELDEQLKEMTFRGTDLETIKRAALSSGRLHPLSADGATKVLGGETTTSEILRVTRSATTGDDPSSATNETVPGTP